MQKNQLVEEFIACALAFKDLADKLGYDNFSQVMTNVLSYLYDNTLTDEEKLLKAYDSSHIFGGMGSWADSPPYTAYIMGLTDEYNKITDDFWQVRIKARLIKH